MKIQVQLPDAVAEMQLTAIAHVRHNFNVLLRRVVRAISTWPIAQSHLSFDVNSSAVAAKQSDSDGRNAGGYRNWRMAAG